MRKTPLSLEQREILTHLPYPTGNQNVSSTSQAKSHISFSSPMVVTKDTDMQDYNQAEKRADPCRSRFTSSCFITLYNMERVNG